MTGPFGRVEHARGGASELGVLCLLPSLTASVHCAGGLLTAVLLLFVLMGVPAGYYASNTYKGLRGTEWKATTVLAATLFPGLVAFVFFILNFFIWGQVIACSLHAPNCMLISFSSAPAR